MDILLKGLLYAAVLGAQYVLSSQKNVYLGAVVPLLFVAEWGKGREVFRKNQEKELERMRIQDLK